MQKRQLAFVSCFLMAFSSLSWAGPVTFQFSQAFEDGALITGQFSGTDTNGDGRLYSASRLFEIFTTPPGGGDPLIPFGNEFEFLELTFTGFSWLGAGPLTQTYDKSVADMDAFENAFKAFSYNLDGGPLGDDPDEGISFGVQVSPGSPTSTSYALGQAFNFAWNDYLDPDIGACGTGPCGAVFESEFAQGGPGFVVINQALSSASVRTASVPLPGVFWLMASGVVALFASARLTRHPGRRAV